MESAPGAGARIRRSSVIDPSNASVSGIAWHGYVRFSPAAFALARSGRGRRGLPVRQPLRAMARGLALLAVCLLCACATPQAADIGGRWRPLNRFADAPQAIPLQQAYVYQASPADGTLKAMLARWARDARMTLSYQHPNDYTLHGPVGGIRTTSLEQAAAALSSAYGDHGVHVAVDRAQIVVSQRTPGDAAAAAGRDG